MTSGGAAKRTGGARVRHRAVAYVGGGLVALAVVTTASVRALPAPACAGDCGRDGMVTIEEVITLVTIANDNAPAAACPDGDVNGDTEITVDEIVMAVTNVLEGCPAVTTPTPSPTATPQPSVTPLGRRRLVLDPATSQFEAIIAPGFPLRVGSFRGQTGGMVEDAYLELDAGVPDARGLATIAVVGGSEYIFADGANVGVVLCLKPRLPVPAAGVVACNGGFDFSIVTAVDHNIGQVGVDGFSVDQCVAAGGTVEGVNQICATGSVGQACRSNTECETAPGAGNGECGLEEATCTEGRVGEPCRAAAACDTDAELADGVCGAPGGHPGVCNGPLQVGQGLGDSGPGAASIAPVPQLGLSGLLLELSIERATPCGDEGAGVVQPFAMTTGQSRTTIANFNNGSEPLELERAGQNFVCSDWANSAARFVLNFPALHQFQNSDVLTVFTFEDRGLR